LEGSGGEAEDDVADGELVRAEQGAVGGGGELLGQEAEVAGGGVE